MLGQDKMLPGEEYNYVRESLTFISNSSVCYHFFYFPSCTSVNTTVIAIGQCLTKGRRSRNYCTRCELFLALSQQLPYTPCISRHVWIVKPLDSALHWYRLHQRTFYPWRGNYTETCQVYRQIFRIYHTPHLIHVTNMIHPALAGHVRMEWPLAYKGN